MYEEYVALGVFALVYALIIGGRRLFGLPIWAAMLIGAALMVGLQVTSAESALRSVNLDVIAFLFGMFSIVSALDRAGVLRVAAARMLGMSRGNPHRILMAFVVGMGLLAAFLVNDTIALLGVPLAVYVARHAGIRPAVLLLALAFGITVGSVMTPIGNPQNLLIAVQSGMPLPFTTFLLYLSGPTAANLFLTYLILKVYYRKELSTAGSTAAAATAAKTTAAAMAGVQRKYAIAAASYDDDAAPAIETPADWRRARLPAAVLLVTIAGFVISELLRFSGIATFSLSVVAMMGAAAVYALSGERREIARGVDYSVLVFFAAMFVVTSALWSSGAISIITGYLPRPDPGDPEQSSAVISIASLTLSQVMSNVPFVSLYNFVMLDSGFTGGQQHVGQWLMLAAASTIAGNLTVLGAASNVIIVEAAESRGVRAFTFMEFFKVGSVVTAANMAVYYAFFFVLRNLS